MRRGLAIGFLVLLLATPVFVEAGETLHSDIYFQVKSAGISYTDEGVFVEFQFFQPAKRYNLVVPANVLDFKVRGVAGTKLQATYRQNCSMYSCSEYTLKATVLVSRQSVIKQWLEKIGLVSREYETAKNSDVIPTISKKK